MDKKVMMRESNFNTIIFDLGAVLIDWNPRYVYRDIFRTEEAMEFFLSHICTPDWNEEQDAGRSFNKGTEILIAQYPEYDYEIRAFYKEWEKMLGGPILEMVDFLEQLKLNDEFKLLALTNWSAESFPIALEKFDFLQCFDGILVSGQENLKKPDPKIYHLLLERYKIEASKAIFIDDNLRNINAARELGINSIHFQNFKQFQSEFDNFCPKIK